MYDVYISDMLLPIAPSKITMQINGKNETATLINDGEISILKNAGLSTVNFTVLLPNVKYPFAQYPDGFKAAEYYLDTLERLKNQKKPFQFIVTRKTPINKRLFNTNLTVSLENYQIIDDAKNGFDVEVQINLKQFREYGTKTFKVETPSATAPIIVNPSRTESTAPSSGSGGGGSGGGKTGSSTKTYKVQIPGMAVLSIKAGSVQEAITKAMGSNWTGDVYVDGKTYYVVKGKISQKPASKTKVPSTAKKVVEKVTSTVKKVVSTVSSVISKVTSALKTAAKKTNTTAKKTTTVKTPAKANLKNKLVLKK